MSSLLVQDDGGIRTITFNRPDAKNAMNLAMRRELCEFLDAADRDPSVTAVVVTGADPVSDPVQTVIALDLDELVAAAALVADASLALTRAANDLPRLFPGHDADSENFRVIPGMVPLTVGVFALGRALAGVRPHRAPW